MPDLLAPDSTNVETEPGLTAAVGPYPILVESLVLLCNDLHFMFSNGAPHLVVLDAVLSDPKHAIFHDAIADIREKVNAGSTFSEAFAAHKNIFNPVFVSMLHAGELSGSLDVVLGMIPKVKAALDSNMQITASQFLNVFGVMIESGFPIIQSLRIAQELCEQPLHSAAQILLDEINEGASLADAASKSPEVFNPVVVAFLKCGEMSGQVPEVCALIERLDLTKGVFAVRDFYFMVALYLDAGYPIQKTLETMKPFFTGRLAEAIDAFSAETNEQLRFYVTAAKFPDLFGPIDRAALIGAFSQEYTKRAMFALGERSIAS